MFPTGLKDKMARRLKLFPKSVFACRFMINFVLSGEVPFG